MKTYNEIVDDLEVLEKEVPVKIATASASTLSEAKAYTDTKFSTGMKRLIVEVLPTQDIDANAIYMVLDPSSSQVGNVYNEYMFIENDWELIGTTATAAIELFEHNIVINYSNNAHIDAKIYTTSSTQFTKQTLNEFLRTNEIEISASGGMLNGNNVLCFVTALLSYTGGNLTCIAYNVGTSYSINYININSNSYILFDTVRIV